jgi:hypothetical protein
MEAARGRSQHDTIPPHPGLAGGRPPDVTPGARARTGSSVPTVSGGGGDNGRVRLTVENVRSTAKGLLGWAKVPSKVTFSLAQEAFSAGAPSRLPTRGST